MVSERTSPALKWTAAVVALLAVACVHAPATTTDIAARIKAIAAYHDAGTIATDDVTTYSIFAFRSPIGYRTMLTLTERAGRAENIAVTIAERVADHQRLTVLVDDAGDGMLDYLLVAQAPSLRSAQEIVNSGRADLSRDVTPLQAVYDVVIRDLRAKPVNLTAAQFHP